jgi:hypothetical protein
MQFRNVLIKVDAIEAPTEKKQKKSKVNFPLVIKLYLFYMQNM